tara:strand:- start:2423 stop:3337 length:915 start_codon:yes stop_codon:yes gene_type:complete
MSTSCFKSELVNPDSEAFVKATNHWNSALANMPVDEQLLAHVLMNNIEGAKAAIESGANVNATFTNRIIVGPDALSPETQKPVLQIAAEDLDIEMVELLLVNGANPNLRRADTDVDLFTGQVRNYSYRNMADGTRIHVSGLDVLELAIQYGLTPTAVSLEWLDQALSVTYGSTGPAMLAAFEELWARATPAVRREYVEISAANRARAADAASLRSAERYKRRAEADALMQQHNESLRRIGTRICKEEQGNLSRILYTGYVVGLAAEKVQIRVSNAVPESAPSVTLGGFRESIIWDYPSSWYMCE